MLGDQDEPIDTPMAVQDSIQETVADESIIEFKETSQDTNAETFNCHWDTCDHQFLTLRDLALHVNNSHIAALPWNTRYQKNINIRSNRDVLLVCKWVDCWNPHPFAYQMRMVDHVRAHTLEKP